MRLPSEVTGVDFRNDLVHDDDFNIYTYRNFYNGGGVAIGDVNGDTLPDLFLTANQGPNRLYLNGGDFRFKDVTEAAGVAGERGWSTGVTFADVNGDGALDIYVCNSGDAAGDDRANELYINDGAGGFRESAAAYGLDDRGLSTHAAFFDYDRDGDLDVYLLNNSFEPIGSFNLSKRLREVRDTLGGDKLYRNLAVETGETRFVDVSAEAGLYQSVIGFGLGVTVGDVDLDGWLDIYVSNDFFERDYLYRNRGDGTFEEVLQERIPSTSAASMGADMADLNGDGYPEIFVTDMLPADERRLKLNTTFESWDNFYQKERSGYHRQFTRNTLQVNRGGRSFSEQGRLFGVEATDWSWGALLVDLDSDGDRDIYVANGIYQDLTNQDYIRYLSSKEARDQVIQAGEVDYAALVGLIPSEPVANVAFENLGGEEGFRRDTLSFGLGDEGFSNGAAYGDLDGDGDLDLVVNNVNGEAWVYRNDLPRDSLHNSWTLHVDGPRANTKGVGTRATVYTGSRQQSGELIPTRGFQSSSEPALFFGLGAAARVDSVRVTWPTGADTVLYDVPAGRLWLRPQPSVTSGMIAASPSVPRQSVPTPTFRELSAEALGVDFVHRESAHLDWDRERLVFHDQARPGPCVAVGDVDGDGLDDFYIGGATGQAGALYRQDRRGRFRESAAEVWAADAKFEDTDATFFDADGDGDLDLLVASGSSEFAAEQLRLRDRLYLNDGGGEWTRVRRAGFPASEANTSCVVAADVDGDGDVDVFAGTRQSPRLYGVPAPSFLFLNDGAGRFERLSSDLLDTLGLVTDAAVLDGGEGLDPVVLVAREWGAPVALVHRNGTLGVDGGLTAEIPAGWWSSLSVADLDGDGDEDVVAGNHGLNSRFRASAERPVSMVVGDFDGNGSPEQIISRYLDSASYPITLRHDLVKQVPVLQKRFLEYDSYFGKRVGDIFSASQLERAYRYEASELRSGWWERDGGRLRYRPFPTLAQNAPVFATAVLPSTAAPTVVLGGNLFTVKPEVGRYDGSQGVLVTGIAAEPTAVEAADFVLDGEVRDFGLLTVGGQAVVVVARNDRTPQFFAIQPRPHEL